MKILGIGVDIVKNRRFQPLIRNQKFIKRTFGPNELKFSKNKVNRINFFAKRFAAKEAFVKSIGIGFRKGINFKDICVKKNKLGKPTISYSNKVKEILNKYSVHFDDLGIIDGNSIKYNADINLPIEELEDAHKYWLKKYMDS